MSNLEILNIFFDLCTAMSETGKWLLVLLLTLCPFKLKRRNRRNLTQN